MKKGDWMIASCILTVMLLSFAAFWVPERDAQERQAVIIVDGTEYARYKLSPNFSEIIEINTQFGYNKLEIDCGKIRMLDRNSQKCDTGNHHYLPITGIFLKDTLKQIFCK